MSDSGWNPLNSWCECGCTYLADRGEAAPEDQRSYPGLRRHIGELPIFCPAPPAGHVAIYCLLDPDAVPRYVGKTKTPRLRYMAHMREASQLDRHKDRWIRSLIRAGHLPAMIQWSFNSPVPEEAWEDAEVEAIATVGRIVQSCGRSLTNATQGGLRSGVDLTEEGRRRIGEAQQGRVVTTEEREWLSLKVSETVMADPEERRRRSERAKGRPKGPETLAKMSAAHRSERLMRVHVDANRGEANHQAKLDWDVVREIRRLSVEGATGKDLAQRFGVGTAQVSRIIRGTSWKEDS